MLDRQMWMVADRCNLSCTYCYFETGEYRYTPSQLTAADYDRWLERCAAYGTVSDISLTGGEPLLRQDLPDLLVVARRYAPSVHVFTNAVRVTDEIAVDWARLGCDADVSIDHVTLSLPDQIRGGTKASLAGIDRLDAAGVPLQVVMVVTALNWRDVPALAERARARGWRTELLLVSVPAHHPLSLTTLTELERAELIAILDGAPHLFASSVYRARVRQYLRTGRVPLIRSCATGQEGVFVNTDGHVWVCAHRASPLGNIRDLAPDEVARRKGEILRDRPAGPCSSLGCMSMTN